MGSKKCFTVGYGYTLDFAYVFAERIDKLYTIHKSGKAVWGEGYIVDNNYFDCRRLYYHDREATAACLAEEAPPTSSVVPSSVSIKTGTHAVVYPSYLSEFSTVYIYDGSHSSVPEMDEWTSPYQIGYLNTCMFTFPDVFIGDNVQTIEKFSIVAGNNTFVGISGYQELPDGNANPVDIIYNILVEDLKMEPSAINTTSFQSAGLTLYNEGLGVGLVMGTTRKVMDWIEDQLGIMDGVLFIDPITNLINIKLLRDDYDINTIVQLDDSNTSKISLESVSWAETFNKFVFKYTYLKTGKEVSVEYINTAARQVLGYDRTKTISFPSINSGAVLQLVANRIINKMGIPLSALKVAVDYIDYPNIGVGDAVKLSSDRLQVVDKVFRVMKITGDNEEKTSVNLECVEDVFAKTFNIVMPQPDESYTPIIPDYSLEAPIRVMAKDAPRESGSYDAIFWGAAKVNESELVMSVNCYEVGGLAASATPVVYGELSSVIPTDITGLNSSEVSSKEYNRDFTFQVNDIDGSLYEFFGTPTTLQNMTHLAYIGDEAFCLKTMTDLGGGSFEVTGVIRGLNDTSIVQHNVGTAIFISPVGTDYLPELSISSATPALRFFSQNHAEVSPETSLNITYGYTSGKPYDAVPSQTVWGSTKEFSWRPRVPLVGANYRAENSITGGDGEGVVVGYYEITYPNGSTSIINPTTGSTTIIATTTQTGTHYIKHKNSLTHRYENSVSINIT